MIPRPELIVVGMALASATASFGYFGWLAKPNWHGKHAAIPSIVMKAAREIREVDALDDPLESGTSVWFPPGAQNRSKEWVYDVFTPPEIVYDAGLKEFRVTPPMTAVSQVDTASHDVPRESPFGLRLVAVKRMPFRLQLIGFAKTAAGPLGLFENKVTGEVFLGRNGQTIAGLALVIEEIDLSQRQLSDPANPMNYQPQARATVWDPSKNERITLTSTERTFSDKNRAIVATDEVNEAQRDLGEGETIEVAGAIYQIADVQVSPATVVVSRQIGKAGGVERRTLKLPEPGLSIARAPSI